MRAFGTAQFYSYDTLMGNAWNYRKQKGDESVWKAHSAERENIMYYYYYYMWKTDREMSRSSRRERHRRAIAGTTENNIGCRVRDDRWQWTCAIIRMSQKVKKKKKIIYMLVHTTPTNSS